MFPETQAGFLIMSIEERIHEQRDVWMSKNYPIPDTIIMSPKTLWEFMTFIQNTLSYLDVIANNGKYKYRGMDIVSSPNIDDNDVRVCKTKID